MNDFQHYFYNSALLRTWIFEGTILFVLKDFLPLKAGACDVATGIEFGDFVACGEASSLTALTGEGWGSGDESTESCSMLSGTLGRSTEAVASGAGSDGEAVVLSSVGFSGLSGFVLFLARRP